MPRPHTVRYCLKMAAIFVALLLPLRGGAQTLITSDSLFNTGSPLSQTYTSGGAQPTGIITEGSSQLWLIYPDAFSVSGGTGTITQTYTGAGYFSEAVNLSDYADPGGVAGYPFIRYGTDQYGTGDINIAGQPPQFPQMLTSMSSLVIDMTYNFNIVTGSNIDMLFDNWVCTANPVDENNCIEIMFTPYYSGFYPGNGPPKEIDIPATINGTATTWKFNEYLDNSGRATAILVPCAASCSSNATGPMGQSVRFDMLPMLKTVVADSGVTFQWFMGVELGSEFGAHPPGQAMNYTLTWTKLDIEETLAGSKPAPPTNLTGVVI